jgi:hypothetical protein
VQLKSSKMKTMDNVAKQIGISCISHVLQLYYALSTCRLMQAPCRQPLLEISCDTAAAVFHEGSPVQVAWDIVMMRW